MKKWNINNLLYNDSTVFEYKFDTVLEDGTAIDLFDDSTFKAKCLYKYTSWCVTNPGFYDTETNQFIDSIGNDINGAVTMFQALFTMWKNDRRKAFTKLYEGFIANFNPLWNVDGVTGTIREISGTDTGSQENAHTGHDKTNTEDNGSITRSGSETDLKTGNIETAMSGSRDLTRTGSESDNQYGTKTNTRTGSETNASSGADTDTVKKTTFDSGTLRDTDQTLTDYGKSETKTYNSVRDVESYTDYETEKVYNSVKDSETFQNRKDTETYNNLTDQKTYNNVKDTHDLDGWSDTVYNSKNTRTDNLAHYQKDIELEIRQGNIGVTKSTDLLEGLLDLEDKNMLIDYFIADFIHNYCVL